MAQSQQNTKQPQKQNPNPKASNPAQSKPQGHPQGQGIEPESHSQPGNGASLWNLEGFPLGFAFLKAKFLS